MASGELVPLGNTKCRVGGTAATSIRVNCLGVTRPARSEIPFAALLCAKCAAAKSLNTAPITSQTSLFGSFCPGSLLVSAPNMFSSSGTSHRSSTTFDHSIRGWSIFFILSSSTSSLYATEFRMISMSATFALSHIVVRAAF